MKTFTKAITKCQECPNVGYIHYDGEGESCPYEYYFPVCNSVRDAKILRIAHGRTIPVQEPRQIPIPKDRIPEWCPLLP